jgi:hypothetical protein
MNRYDIVEARLAGTQATLGQVVDALDYSLACYQPSRIELHYSRFTEEPLSPQMAELRITRLLRQRGRDNVEVAVLPNRAQDAIGQCEHVLRLHVASATTHAGDSGAGLELAPGLPQWLAPCIKRFFACVPVASSSQWLAPAHPTPAALSHGDKLALLRRALGLALAYRDSETGSSLRQKRDGRGKVLPQAVESVQVTVRQGHLHQALAPLVGADQAWAVAILTPLLSGQGLQTVDGFWVDYRLKLWNAGAPQASAGWPTEQDVQIALRMAA